MKALFRRISLFLLLLSASTLTFTSCSKCSECETVVTVNRYGTDNVKKTSVTHRAEGQKCNDDLNNVNNKDVNTRSTSADTTYDTNSHVNCN